MADLAWISLTRLCHFYILFLYPITTTPVPICLAVPHCTLKPVSRLINIPNAFHNLWVIRKNCKKKRFLGFLKMFFEEQQNEWAAGRGKKYRNVLERFTRNDWQQWRHSESYLHLSYTRIWIWSTLKSTIWAHAYHWKNDWELFRTLKNRPSLSKL